MMIFSPGPAAAAAQKKRLQEEEQMVTYHKDDLGDWEFKIIRTNSGKFKNPDNLRMICEQEAKAGWEMLEKFDDQRIRFKRHIKNRSNDQFLDFDPYRTQYGLGEGSIVIIVALVTAIILGIVFVFTRLY